MCPPVACSGAMYAPSAAAGVGTGPGGRAIDRSINFARPALGDHVGRLDVEVQQAVPVQVAEARDARCRPSHATSQASRPAGRRSSRCATRLAVQRLEDHERDPGRSITS